MSKTSPTQRSKKLLVDNGYTVQIVERWCVFAKRRQDLFNVLDLVAIDGNQILGIQTTSGSNVSARIEKILNEPKAKLWIESGGRLFVHGWRKLVRTGRWECREVEITTEMFERTDSADIPKTCAK